MSPTTTSDTPARQTPHAAAIAPTIASEVEGSDRHDAEQERSPPARPFATEPDRGGGDPGRPVAIDVDDPVQQGERRPGDDRQRHEQAEGGRDPTGDPHPG